MADVEDEPPGSTYFHATRDEEIGILVFVNLRKVEAVFKSHRVLC